MSRNQQTLYMPKSLGSQAVSFNASTATAATALPVYTTGVRLYATQNVWIEFEGTAVATTCVFLPAGIVEYFPALLGGSAGMVISSLGVTQSGTLYVTPL